MKVNSGEKLEELLVALIEFLLLSKHQIFQVATKLGLTNMQALCLVFVLPDTPRPMHTLSEILNCDASNVTGIVDGLVRKQLLSRIESPEDRRYKLVAVTTAGQKMRQQVVAALSSENNLILSKLNQNELNSFVELLQKIVHE